jgi:hypothetical protein
MKVEKKLVARPQMLEVLLAARKAFRVRSAVQAFTPREALALGLIRRDFGPSGEWRVRVGKALMRVAAFVRRLRGSPVECLDPDQVAKAFNNPPQAIVEAEPAPECRVFAAYRELVDPHGFP